MRNGLLLLILINLSTTVMALDDEDPCQGASAMHQGHCVNQKLEVADKELNKTYQEAIERIKQEDKYLNSDLEARFRTSQRAWLEYRDAYCEFEGLSTGAAGGWAGVHSLNCILEMTEERISYFKAVFWQ